LSDQVSHPHKTNFFFISVIDGGGLLHGQAASPLGIKPSVTIERETERAPEPEWTFRETENRIIILKYYFIRTDGHPTSVGSCHHI
jgi:hypothetical protein